MTNTVPIEKFPSKIYFIRNRKVMLDRDLAALYDIETKRLKEQELTNCDRLNRLKHSSALPCAFTEQGVAMLSSVLRSERAIHVNIQIIRVFTRLRRAILENADLRKELEDLKQISEEHFRIVFETLDQLINIENKPKKIYPVQFAPATI